MTTVSSKLESINVMMTAIGESPVNTITSSTTTVNSETQITAIIPKASFINSKEPYDIKVTNTAPKAN